MNIKNVVKVMNFHALVRVDRAKREAQKYMLMSGELYQMLDQIMNNRNLVLDKSVMQPDPKKPSLTFYIGSDFGFCSNYNTLVNHAMNEDDGDKVLIGKKMRCHTGSTVMRIHRGHIRENLYHVEEILKDSLWEKQHSSIRIVYNRYINSTTSRLETMQLYPMEVPRREDAAAYRQDYVVEGDLSEILRQLLLTYIMYEIELACISGYAAENVMRQTTTQESLDKIEEREAQRLMEERKDRREKEFSKVIESFSKMRN
ncbi:MAG: F0F1 ATP synthase subunit gamma [Clostridiales bacterium]|nr:F0F1 ATP synthase subunit gamma [Clostridiales bacterium]